jgi:hypothetical protein
MLAILKRVDEAAVVVDCDLSYEFERDIVDGDVEFVPIGPEIDAVCNANSAIDGLPHNAAGILGNFLIVATDTESGTTRDMTDEEIRKGLAYLERFKDVRHSGFGSALVSGSEGAELLAQWARQMENVWNSL